METDLMALAMRIANDDGVAIDDGHAAAHERIRMRGPAANQQMSASAHPNSGWRRKESAGAGTMIKSS